MSKWLKRGLQNNNTTTTAASQPPEHFPQPPMPPASAATYAQQQSPTAQTSPVAVGYSQQEVPMDVDSDNRRNNKSNYYPPNMNSTNKIHDASRRTPREEGRRSSRSSRSARPSSNRQQATNAPIQYQYQPRTQQQQQQQPVATNAASPPPPQQPYPSPPQTDYKSGTATPPPQETIQPTYPPHAVTADSPPPATSPQAATQRRPAYLLHRDLVIGKGSYGQVCIASRGETEGHSSGRSGKRKKFACKCVMLRNDPKYISKLQEEVNVLRELRGHTNVIRLYDVFCVDNELFIITELGRGGDLFHLLTTHPKHGVTEAYAAKTVAEMLSAVAFLHSRSICHRDLKLENWVLESGKDVWSPLKLIDFGLSTHFHPGQRLSRVVGSSYYVAPEVLKKSYTEACDLWSLGVIVYMLLSGAPPFYGKNDEAIKASIVQGEYTFPHELFRDVSDEAMAFVSTLLSYNTEYRYTADQALTHPWLASNLEPDALQRCKDSAQGVGILAVGEMEDRLEPMEM
mmetsp:Transcript_3643/g.6706  ORF Transcript_3643/g.6706 Transcript_3643/m.6706 type:complete len:514 (-) Transcript_3643:99-1640(-)|eukprot:CAMPEP_0202507460 /NCGR_PEP_ID=MMETSP1361-20130828/51737_1 /ASSEMBLY_ACC=CAM_ASM_000849 /TAXON_ID=210615 /ORGANISM="Staurosira complex sp., Strain CCMP2646" /LENGTH=513 /DNA_ID=CAMNT_0049141585 /DNA_START=552 /DNA_END=2093 /DNA_ORIENTATION=+